MDWSPPWCPKGLPAINNRTVQTLSKRQRLDTERSDIDTSMSASQKPPGESGCPLKAAKAPRQQVRHLQNAAIYKRIHAERRDLQRSGHNLVAFEPHWPTWKPATIQQSWHQGPFVTCTQYRTFGPYLFFFQTCELRRMCIFHQLDDINKQIWSKHWSINIEEANGSDHARSNDNLSALSKDLAKTRD